MLSEELEFKADLELMQKGYLFTHGIYYRQTPHVSLLLGVGDPEHELKDFNERSTWLFMKYFAEKIATQMPILKEANIIKQ